MRFEEALEELESRGPGRMVPDLDRIRALAELLDHPELRYPTIHVTGTNGKTTTVRLMTRILCAHGVSVGAYTSPHLASVRERLALCDDPISEEEFGETFEHLDPFLGEVDRRGELVTYFEALTAMAYLWFADKPVDAGVFEVGMGGEWDATNLIRSEVAVFCSIHLDHPELGSTVEEVAGEKAGIIKKESIVVIQDSGPAVLAIVEARAKELGAPTLIQGREYRITNAVPAVGGQEIAVATERGRYEDLFVPLFGRHQAENTAMAVAASEAFLGRELSPDSLRQALAGATSPGRLEVVSRHPLVVLDGAHNPHAARALSAALPEAFTWRRLHLVLGVLSTKDVAGILAPLAPLADTTYASANSNAKSLSPEQMAAACRQAGMAASAYRSAGEALDAAEAAAEDDDLILVTGSLYTVADARPRYAKD
ncbi:MAG: bifunctional folylpolyglutamate synthase/dihydrofolate synthase [Actinomycetota bacterium]